jgi:hypothetical protein
MRQARAQKSIHASTRIKDGIRVAAYRSAQVELTRMFQSVHHDNRKPDGQNRTGSDAVAGVDSETRAVVEDSVRRSWRTVARRAGGACLATPPRLIYALAFCPATVRMIKRSITLPMNATAIDPKLMPVTPAWPN